MHLAESGEEVQLLADGSGLLVPEMMADKVTLVPLAKLGLQLAPQLTPAGRVAPVLGPLREIIGQEFPDVPGSAVLLRRALVNLLRNAVDAALETAISGRTRTAVR